MPVQCHPGINHDIRLLLQCAVDADFKSAKDSPRVQRKVVLPSALQVVKLLIFKINRLHEAMIFKGDSLGKCTRHKDGSQDNNNGICGTG